MSKYNDKYKKEYSDAIEVLMKTLLMADVRLIENLLINLLAKTKPVWNIHANIGPQQLGGGVWNLTAQKIREVATANKEAGLGTLDKFSSTFEKTYTKGGAKGVKTAVTSITSEFSK